MRCNVVVFLTAVLLVRKVNFIGKWKRIKNRVFCLIYAGNDYKKMADLFIYSFPIITFVLTASDDESKLFGWRQSSRSLYFFWAEKKKSNNFRVCLNYTIIVIMIWRFATFTEFQWDKCIECPHFFLTFYFIKVNKVCKVHYTMSFYRYFKTTIHELTTYDMTNKTWCKFYKTWPTCFRD